MKEYKITQEQLETIEHNKRMLELYAQLIENLCNSEKQDIAYGFELGKIYAYIRDSFCEMMELENEIRNQRLNSES